MKVKLTELHKSLENESFVFVCSTSFESRWYKAAINLDGKRISKAIIIHQSGSHSEIDVGCKLIRERVEITITRDLHFNNSVDKATELKKLFIDELSGIDSLVVDMTTFTHENLLIFYQFFDQLKNKENVTFLYTSATEYSVGLNREDKWLSRGVRDIRSVFGYPGIMYPSQQTHLIILTGFEYERAEKLIKELEPAVISLGIAEPSSHFLPAHKNVNEVFFEKLESFISTVVKINSKVQTFNFSCSDPYKTKKSVLSQVGKLHGYNVVLSPMNTKVSTIGAALAAIEDDSIQICYVEPVEYNTDGYSCAGDEVTIIKSHIDSITSVGELYIVKNDTAIKDRFHRLGADEGLVSSFFNAKHIKHSISTASQEQKHEKITKAALEFSIITNKLVQQSSNKIEQKNWLLYYYTVMNEALCYFELKEYTFSYNLYLKLIPEYENFPMLHHRLAQVLGRLGLYSKSITHFEKTLELVEHYENHNQLDIDYLPSADYSHVKEHTPLLLGYEYWVKAVSHNTLTVSEKIELLLSAYRKTMLSIDYGKVSERTIIEVHNNALYYLMELLSFEVGDVTPLDLNKRLKEHLKVLDMYYQSNDCNDINILDTLSKANSYIGNVDKCIYYVNKIIFLASANIEEYTHMDAGTQQILIEAREVYKKFKFGIADN